MFTAVDIIPWPGTRQRHGDTVDQVPLLTVAGDTVDQVPPAVALLSVYVYL
jgi:hypothetical protein